MKTLSMKALSMKALSTKALSMRTLSSVALVVLLLAACGAENDGTLRWVSRVLPDDRVDCVGGPAYTCSLTRPELALRSENPETSIHVDERCHEETGRWRSSDGAGSYRLLWDSLQLELVLEPTSADSEP